MSDRPIQAGDLVIVVRGHICLLNKFGGVPFRVSRIISQFGGGWLCPVCWQGDIAQDAKLGAQLEGLHVDPHSGIPCGWLRRIPPIEELEGQRTEEKLKEPA